MAIIDKKILESERNAVYVKSNTGSRLTGTVQENKNAFDKFPQLIMDKYNDLIQILTDLGLDSIPTNLSDRYTKAETDSLVSTETSDLIETITFNADNGVFTITTKSGSQTIIDTALEKVPASLSLVDSDGQTMLRITNIDGTFTETNVTSLLNVYTFTDGNTIDFTQNGYGVTAEVRDNSITLNKLSISTISKLEEYVSQASASAGQASASATSSESSANTAIEMAELSESYKNETLGYRNEVNTNKTLVETNKNISIEQATLSQSYAVGGTGTRTNEATDNAKYYMEQAKLYKEQAGEIASGDFVTTTEFEQSKPTITTMTMGASGWTNGTYSFETTYPNSTYNLEIAIADTASTTQLDAYNSAQLASNATSNVVKALGVVPTVDIPIVVKVVKK